MGMSERRNPSVNEVVDTIIAYAKDQTIGPVRGAGRWVLWGAIGAVLLGSGALLVLLGALRAIQTEWNAVGDNWSWSWVPYLIVLVLAIALLVVTLTRINRDHLARTDREDDHGS
jgi:peptidoglycan biosynthesis protein MviN/MurJ (putative lipid II flippase)